VLTSLMSFIHGFTVGHRTNAAKSIKLLMGWDGASHIAGQSCRTYRRGFKFLARILVFWRKLLVSLLCRRSINGCSLACSCVEKNAYYRWRLMSYRGCNVGCVASITDVVRMGLLI
jgi:hypothetical protein